MDDVSGVGSSPMVR